MVPTWEVKFAVRIVLLVLDNVGGIFVGHHCALMFAIVNDKKWNLEEEILWP